MRTLKKSLALVLALVMLLGLGVVGASADNALDNYTDADEIGDAYLEAVGVLTGLGIVDGMTETTIVPQATYTRAQAAKIITTMVLGVNGAKSCVASYAPFDDVAANHWAAGYIAFCKEQGIIDGVTDTTFDPEGTLTGYQWAKMLLAAVGFNANNELEGSSWSLNTARIGREVGLFDGDLAGADHTPLRREQAMLYAFNTLTKVDQVVWSEALGDYIERYTAVIDRYTPEGTLGWTTFKLDSVEGQIIDNEGMGNANTIVDSVVAGEGNVAVDAETGIDMMYHAARVWYVVGKTNTNVYVYDLAKVTEYTCMHADVLSGNVDSEFEKAVDKLTDAQVDSTKTIGEGVVYESYIVDNSALTELAHDYTPVLVKAKVGTLSYRNTATDKTSIGGEVVDNDDILTDISDIEYGDTVIIIKTSSTQKNTDHAWYVYPVTSTEGVVTGITRENGVITVALADGTELEVSNLSKYSEGSNLDLIKSEIPFGRNYTFTLDTHGDLIGLSQSRTLYAFTGASRQTDDYNGYSKVSVYQFVEVGTTNVVEFALTSSSISGLETHKYYDISASANEDGKYVATPVNESDTIFASAYAVKNTNAAGLEFNGSTKNYNVNGYDVSIDPANVTFIIASGSGDDLTFTTCNGVSELLSAYGVSALTSVALDTPAFVVSYNGTGNDYTGSVVFAFDENLTVKSNYVFIPYDVELRDFDGISGDVDTINMTYNGKAYVDGNELDYTVKIGSAADIVGDKLVLERGFYTYKMVNGVVTLVDRVDNGAKCAYVENEVLDVDHEAYGWTIGGIEVVADPKIVDCRTTRYTKIEDMEGLYQGYYLHNDAFVGADEKLTIGYTLNADGDIAVIYVVDSSWHNQLTISVDDAMGADYWTVVDPVRYDLTSNSVSVSLKPDADRTGETVAFDYTLTVDGKETKGTVTAAYANGAFTFNIPVSLGWDDEATLEFTMAYFTGTVDVKMADTAPSNVKVADWTPKSITYNGEQKVSVTLANTRDWTNNSYTFTCNVNGTPVESNQVTVTDKSDDITFDLVLSSFDKGDLEIVVESWK